MFAIRAFSGLTGLALLASRVVCLIVVAWFVVFAAGQSKTAATHQVDQLAGSAPAPAQQQATTEQGGKRAGSHGAATRMLDEAAEAVTSPFAWLTANTSSAWLLHGVDTLLALLVYGLGVGLIARIVRLRV